jgi:hypothetical protein
MAELEDLLVPHLAQESGLGFGIVEAGASCGCSGIEGVTLLVDETGEGYA